MTSDFGQMPVWDGSQNPPREDNPDAAVSWFLTQDEMTRDHALGASRLAPDFVDGVTNLILDDLRYCRDAAALSDKLIEIGNEWTSWDSHRERQKGTDHDLYAKYFMLQTAAAVRLRALGYFLAERYGIDPATLDYGDSG